MSVDLRKRVVDLSKKAAFAANKHGVEGQRASIRQDRRANIAGPERRVAEIGVERRRGSGGAGLSERGSGV